MKNIIFICILSLAAQAALAQKKGLSTEDFPATDRYFVVQTLVEDDIVEFQTCTRTVSEVSCWPSFSEELFLSSGDFNFSTGVEKTKALGIGALVVVSLGASIFLKKSPAQIYQLLKKPKLKTNPFKMNSLNAIYQKAANLVSQRLLFWSFAAGAVPTSIVLLKDFCPVYIWDKSEVALKIHRNNLNSPGQGSIFSFKTPEERHEFLEMVLENLEINENGTTLIMKS